DGVIPRQRREPPKRREIRHHEGRGYSPVFQNFQPWAAAALVGSDGCRAGTPGSERLAGYPAAHEGGEEHGASPFLKRGGAIPKGVLPTEGQPSTILKPGPGPTWRRRPAPPGRAPWRAPPPPGRSGRPGSRAACWSTSSPCRSLS